MKRNSISLCGALGVVCLSIAVFAAFNNSRSLSANEANPSSLVRDYDCKVLRNENYTGIATEVTNYGRQGYRLVTIFKEGKYYYAYIEKS